MELPVDVLQIIKEYSMPVTRPDWRTLHIMPSYLYENEFFKIYYKRYNMNYARYIKYKPLFTLKLYDEMFPEEYNDRLYY